MATASGAPLAAQDAKRPVLSRLFEKWTIVLNFGVEYSQSQGSSLLFRAKPRFTSHAAHPLPSVRLLHHHALALSPSVTGGERRHRRRPGELIRLPLDHCSV